MTDYFANYGEKKFAEFDQKRIQIINAKVTKKLNGENTYMAYLDLDGFKEKLYQNSELLFKDFQKLIKQIVHSYLFGVVQIAYNDEESQVNYFDKILAPKIFSDSIFIPTIDDSERAFAQLSTICSIIVAKSAYIGMTCRGAISLGSTYLDPELNIVLGKSVAKCAELANQIQTYGVVIDPQIEIKENYTTEALLVKVINKDTNEDCKLKFSKISAYLPHQAFDINRVSVIKKYLELKQEYLSREDSSDKIIKRYESGLAVMKLMVG